MTETPKEIDWEREVEYQENRHRATETPKEELSLRDKVATSLVYLCGITDPEKQWPAAEAHADIVIEMVRNTVLEELEKCVRRISHVELPNGGVGILFIKPKEVLDLIRSKKTV